MKRYLLLVWLFMIPATVPAQEPAGAVQQALMLGEWLEYDRALDVLNAIPVDSLSQYNKIRLLILAGDHHSAIKEVDDFIQRWPGSSLEINCKWQRAYSLKKIGLYRDALYDFLELARQDQLLADIAWMNAGFCYQQQGQSKTAGRIFDSLASAGNNQGNDSLLISLLMAQPALASGSAPAPVRKGTIHKANRLISQKKYESARNLLTRFIRYNKGSSLLGQAQYLIGKCLERQGKLTLAAQAYLKVPQVQSGTSWADEALFRAGWCQYKMKAYGLALKHWREAQRRYPQSDFAEVSVFWQGKALEGRGDSLAAREKYRELAAKYEYTYYGWRAREKLSGFSPSGDSLSPDRVAHLAFLDSAVAEPQLEPESWIKNHRRFTQASRLVDMGLLDEAAKLAEAIRKISWNDPVALHYLAQLYSQAGMDPQAIYCAKRSFDLWMGPRPKALIETLYPQRYIRSIEASLAESPLETALVLSVMRQESKFVAAARSRVGARGLMQIMPKTGQQLSGLKKFKPDALYHPETSIAYGTRFLSSLLKQFDGSVVHSLAAYNAGPHRVKQWLKSERCRNDDDYLIEEIPYLETRNYIKKVMVGYYVYRWLLEEKI
ncbi:MAG: transglycosylase SLT domain-containing protein [Candidatus Edwardsbacteria bacterium]|nr:transglycosylase SLT domain-containing protein [Candidatus Edwardsbacteria bacterium]MBU1576014.1 transglycosylase SLT domain-containing protein [Candidatus Edwardsbacteria bacterium]MBU2463268.1 transglycosylase SLT domain-containing protein [Candidatus Edwardsbacteria bacterium]MBU2592937.1 transglycosylase SLT domain-containing protein [Candidatus Edwardsbacteria bacterium]